MASLSRDEARSRIVTLDVIRGVAVMGIFSVNVVAMAMYESAYFYPPAYGFESGWDRLMWAANFLAIDGKMRALFSMLFGASMLLVAERALASGRSAAKVHYARMAVLLLFGLIHFYAVWWGDILAHYALVGMAAFLVWRLPARLLLLFSILAFGWHYTPAILSIPDQFAVHDAAHSPRASPQAVEKWEKRTEWFRPGSEEIAEDRAKHWSPIAHARAQIADNALQPLAELKDFGIETFGLMLLGMAGFRSGFLTGRWSDRSYRLVALIGLGLGSAGFAALAAWVLQSNFAITETLAAVFTASGPLRPLMACGYAALIVLLFRKPGAIRDRFAAVGRTAFSNYLGASIVGMLVFFGFGFGLYANVSRAEAWLLVPPVWLLMLLWSKPWLDRYRYGPFEWLWRTLARWELQPMRKGAAPAAAA